MTFRLTSTALFVMLVACGKKSDGSTKPKDDAAAGPQVAPLTVPPIGVDAIKRMNFVYEAGAAAYDKALTAYKAKTRDWAVVKQHAQEAVQKDPQHLDAHYLLARALSQTGEQAAAVDHLVTVLASDYWRYGPAMTKEKDLTDFFTTQHGQAITALATTIAAAYKKRTDEGIWLVARRSAYKWPKDLGAQYSTTRGELYAYDRETKRYLRLTHTDHKVAGFVRAPGGTEVAVFGFDKIDRPKTPADAPGTFVTSWVLIFDTTTWQPIGPKVSVPAAREVALGYGAGDQLLIGTSAATGRWTTGEPVVLAVDKTTGKTTKVATPLPVPRIALTLDEGRVVRAPDGVTATWTNEPPTAPSLKTSAGATIEVPESHLATQSTLALAPTSGRIAFATAVDPCAKDVAPSLYVAEPKGTLKHLLTAKSRFVTRWVDANTLAYEDGDGALRLWDGTAGREAGKLENKPGIALDVLSLAPAPLCKGSPPVVEPAGAGSGDEPPLPPEELPPEEPPGEGSAPITRPQ
ncbi:MAG: tetratricopeptide repeat protein [Kofleriaceae bacterium]|nr:tetratricopeptide repeat protein [Kofleriaceae bacterium]